jgi:hypothetical protein
VGSNINTSTNTGVVAIGQGITSTNTDAVLIGRAASGGGAANVTIGADSTGTGANCVRIGNGVTTGTNTGVVAIGQGVIISGASATDNIIIGRNARNGSGGNQSDTIVIGRDSTTGSQGGSVTTDNNTIIGSNSVIEGSFSGIKTIQRNILLGSSITMQNSSTGSQVYQNNILIGSSLTVGKQTGGNSSAIVIASNASVGDGTRFSVIIGGEIKGGAGSGSGQNVIIGYQANENSDGQFSICIGKGSSLGNAGGGLQSYNTMIGYSARNDQEKSRVIGIGAFAYPRHYGAESRRIDANTSLGDTANPSRHSEDTAWIGTTTAATPTTQLTLFGVANEFLTLQNQEIISLEVMIHAKRNGVTDSFSSIIYVSIVRGINAASTTLVSAPIETHRMELGPSAGACVPVFTANTAVGYLDLNVTGPAEDTWFWTANIIKMTRTRTE